MNNSSNLKKVIYGILFLVIKLKIGSFVWCNDQFIEQWDSDFQIISTL